MITKGSARWHELVQIGIIKTADRNWFLGDAALEIAPMGDSHASNGSLNLLADYAAEIDVKPDTLRIYRQVASKWPDETRLSSTSWRVHQALMGQQHLIKPGMKLNDATRALGQKVVPGRTGTKSDVEDRAAAAREYLADPEVAAAAVEDPATRRNVSRGIDNHLQQQASKRTERTDNIAKQDPVDRRMDGLKAITDLGAAAERFSRDATEALRHVGDLPDGERYWLTGAIDRAEQTVQAARRYLELGKSEIDAEIKALLDSEAS